MLQQQQNFSPSQALIQAQLLALSLSPFPAATDIDLLLASALQRCVASSPFFFSTPYSVSADTSLPHTPPTQISTGYSPTMSPGSLLQDTSMSRMMGYTSLPAQLPSAPSQQPSLAGMSTYSPFSWSQQSPPADLIANAFGVSPLSTASAPVSLSSLQNQYPFDVAAFAAAAQQQQQPPLPTPTAQTALSSDAGQSALAAAVPSTPAALESNSNPAFTVTVGQQQLSVGRGGSPNFPPPAATAADQRRAPVRFSTSKQKRPNRPIEMPPAPPGSQHSWRQIVVHYLALEVDDASLAHLYRQLPGFMSAHVLKAPVTNLPRGFGYLWFDSEENAKSAILATSGRVLAGKRVRLSFAVPQTPPPTET